MKAKDLRGKNIEDIEENPKEDDDAVAAAYENISKRLESIRNGKNSGDDSDDEVESRKDADEERETTQEPELTEWKGPRPPKKEDLKPMDDEEEEDEDLRKVKLNNLEDEEEKKSKHDEEEEEIDPLDDGDEDDKRDEPEEAEKPKKKDWEPEEGDPLDEDSEDEKKESHEEPEDEEKDMEELEGKSDFSKDSSDEEETAVDEEKEDINSGKEEEREEFHSEMRDVRRPMVSESSDMPEDATGRDEHVSSRGFDEPMEHEARREQPDTLEDLAEQVPGRPMHEEEDDYSIPSLKGSGQTSHMGYNANPPRESVGQSYSPRGNMDGNDPNNFFSQHQNQAPKRANKFHLLVLVIIGIAVIGFTVYVLKGGFGGLNLGTSSEASPSPSATATPEPTPTPTPEPEIERGNYTVKVLNGTSTSGLAAKVRDALKEKGYKTSAPGNADEKDVAQTEIRVKEGSESAQLFERLKLDLAPDYDAKQGEALDSKSKDDAEVIIGAK